MKGAISGALITGTVSGALGRIGAGAISGVVIMT
jgi:hypothetical protein